MPLLQPLREFLRLEAASGILLGAAALLALLLANSPLSGFYNLLLDTPVGVRVGALAVEKPLLLWINDGFMAVFFLLIGLEVRREFLEGELSEPRKIMLPAIAALGGMLVPVAIYLAFNQHDPVSRNGWAIPAATDIAFALGVLSLLGKRVPAALKTFLLTLAIFDDLGAIVVIAVFYTGGLSLLSLGSALVVLAALVLLNRRGVRQLAPYVLLGIALWLCVLKSGVHATLAGVALAFTLPSGKDSTGHDPLHATEQALHPWVAYGILPVFAFANAGISLGGIGVAELLAPASLGIVLGLFLGKQAGVFGFCWLGAKLGLVRLSAGIGWRAIYGVSLLCGIGFTMSLFISSLAFEQGTGPDLLASRLGILIGSLLSGVAGYLVLRAVLPDEGSLENPE